MSGTEPPRSFVVSEGQARERLDRVCALAWPDRSRSEIQRWIDEGCVTVDGTVATRTLKPKAGARVEAQPPPPPPSDAVPEAIPITVVFEDAHLLVVDKPAGLVVHPAPGHASGTLVNAVLHHVREHDGEVEDDDSTPSRPGIVHRLDQGTSGVMVIAKTIVAREALMARFAAHDLERSYLAIVVGAHPAEATYDTWYGRHPGDRKRFTSRITHGKRAVTHARRVEELRGATLVRCRLETGRTHQIRVHLSEHGFPLLGDRQYGGVPRDPALRALGEALGRQALHATTLGFPHPVTGEALRFESPLPPALAELLAALRA
jgi:23S rRNA pseudouridine1911/1915/1917 synthase